MRASLILTFRTVPRRQPSQFPPPNSARSRAPRFLLKPGRQCEDAVKS